MIVPSSASRIAANRLRSSCVELAYASSVLPLTYGLRALRRVLLDGASLSMVAGDLVVLLAFSVVLSGLGAWAFSSALRYARRNGALSVY